MTSSIAFLKRPRPGRLLAAGAVTTTFLLGVPFSASGAAPVARPAATGLESLATTAQGRTFSAVVGGRATAVFVCDVAPVSCAVARPAGRGRWTATLPAPGTSYVPVDQSSDPSPPPAPAAAAGEPFHVAVYVARGRSLTRREFRGILR